jgi:hypothetical protein
VADDAVPSNLSGLRNSLLTGRFTGSFSKIGILGEILSTIAQQKQWVGKITPWRKEQGDKSNEQGAESGRSGKEGLISSAPGVLAF